MPRWSQRKLLRRALDPLDELTALVERYPEARVDLERQVGAARLERISVAHGAIRGVVAVVEASAPTTQSDDAVSASLILRPEPFGCKIGHGYPAPTRRTRPRCNQT